MLHKPVVPDQQGVRDFLTEGVTSLSPLEMNRVLQNCGYDHQRAVSERQPSKTNRVLPIVPVAGLTLTIRPSNLDAFEGSVSRQVSRYALHSPRVRSLYYAFDTNLRPRGSRDILKASEFGTLHGITGDLANSLYMAVPFIASRFAVAPKDKNYLATNQVDRRLEIAGEYAKAAAKFGACLEGLPAHRKPKFKSGAVTAVAAITFRYQGVTAWEFWSGVAQNEGLKRGDPRLALCTDLMLRKVRGGSFDTFAPSIIAWNAFFNERQLQQIKLLDAFTPIIDGTPFDGKVVNPLKQAA